MPYCSQCGTLEQPDQQFCPQCGKATGGAFAEAGPMPYFPMEVATAPNTQPLAGYGWRVLGYLIDEVILAVAVTLPLRALHLNAYAVSTVNVLITFVYGTLLLTYASGQTLGMKVARVRVANVIDSVALTNVQALKRTFIFSALSLVGTLYHYTRYLHPSAHEKIVEAHHALLAFALVVPLLLDLLWPLWDKDNQTLSDKFARTVVLRPVSSTT